MGVISISMLDSRSRTYQKPYKQTRARLKTRFRPGAVFGDLVRPRVCASPAYRPNGIKQKNNETACEDYDMNENKNPGYWSTSFKTGTPLSRRSWLIAKSVERETKG